MTKIHFVSIFTIIAIFLCISLCFMACVNTSSQETKEDIYYTVKLCFHSNTYEVKVKEGYPVVSSSDINEDLLTILAKNNWTTSYTRNADLPSWDIFHDEVKCNLKLYHMSVS